LGILSICFEFPFLFGADGPFIFLFKEGLKSLGHPPLIPANPDTLFFKNYPGIFPVDPGNHINIYRST